ncbi:MAG: chemotaxis protein CheX [Proteobacteria bacterium]|nr:chemotaxis protein CheX [Pseudomonadota bacterium]MBU1715808.1 chemotaxis protein CheX [Pseudomonadota bacterium]
MKDSLQKAVYATLAEIFGTMFFVPIEPLDEFPPAESWQGGGDSIEAVIGFNHQESGKVRFYFPLALARKVSANFMGIKESDLEDRQVVDTIKECANMTVGCLLGKIDFEGVCSLDIPEAQEITGFSPEQLAVFPDLCVFETEFGLLWVDCAAVGACETCQK